jgi:FtsH-binding integral membrane protein
MRHSHAATRARKSGAIDGLNLFFGALLGANLGTLEGLRLVHFLMMIALLAGMVMALRMVSTGEERPRVLMLLSFYAVLLGAVLVSPSLRPEGLSAASLERLIATMAVWVGLALAVELSPTRADRDDPV